MRRRFALVCCLLICTAYFFGCAKSEPETALVAIQDFVPESEALASSDDPADENLVEEMNEEQVAEESVVPAEVEWEYETEKVAQEEAELYRLTAEILTPEAALGVKLTRAEGTAWWELRKKRIAGGDQPWEVESKELKSDRTFADVANEDIIAITTKDGVTVGQAKTDQQGYATIPIDFTMLVSLSRIFTQLTVKAAGQEVLVELTEPFVLEHVPVEYFYQKARDTYREKRYAEAGEWARKVRLRDASFHKAEMLYVMATEHQMEGRSAEARRAYLSVLLEEDVSPSLKKMSEERLGFKSSTSTP